MLKKDWKNHIGLDVSDMEMKIQQQAQEKFYQNMVLNLILLHSFYYQTI